MKLMLQYKNSELKSYKKIIDNYEHNLPNLALSTHDVSLNDNSIKSNNSTNVKLHLDKINKLQNEVSSLKTNLLNKDKIIESLNAKLKNFSENLNKKIKEMRRNSNENINQAQEQVGQLLIERDELERKNEELTKGLLKFDDKVKEANLIFLNKTKSFNKTILAYKNKMKEYKNKICLLKKKIDELHAINKNLKLKENLGNNYDYPHKNRLVTARRVYLNNDDIVKKYREFSVSPSAMNRNKHLQKDYDVNKRNNYKINDVINNSNQKIHYIDNRSDYNQKNYIENYKSFLSELDNQWIK